MEAQTAVYCYHAVFSEVAKLHKLVSENSLGGAYLVSRCVRPCIQFTPEYPFNKRFEMVKKLQDYNVNVLSF